VQCVPAIIPSDYFNTLIWTGDGISGRAITVGFQPDMSWYKSRNNAYDHNLSDSVRGAQKQVRPNRDIAEVSATDQITAFTSTGLTLGNGGDANGGSNQTYVAWNWKAGGTAVSNTDGTITSQVSANVDAGFSIVKYTGNENANQTVGHGLSQTPEIVFTKQLDGTREWTVPLLSGFSTGNYLVLNDTNTLADDNNRWSSISSSTITIGASPFTNGSGSPYISYFFHSVAGYSKVGSYTGTGATGNVQYVGFEPAFLMIKNTTGGSSWVIFDNKRNPSNPKEDALFPNLSSAEYTFSNTGINFLSNSFSLISNPGETNGSGQTYIFLAIK
jgi:hypothetical protein